MKEIPLFHKGKIAGVTRISDNKYAEISRYKWFLSPNGYAVRWEGTKTIYMHKVILGLGEGDRRQGDHIDRNRLNNLDSNLRILKSSAEQQQNQSLSKNNVSGYRGVSWDSAYGKWKAAVVINGRKKFLGRFDDPEQAGKVASDYRRKYMPYSN